MSGLFHYTPPQNIPIRDVVVQARLQGAARGLNEAGLIAVAWCACSLAVIFVALRCYARWRESRRLFSDDYWMILALSFLLCNAILQTLQTPSLYYLVFLAAGRVQQGPELMRQGNIYVRYEFVIIAFFWTICWSVKASFLALYYRLFDGLPRYRSLWWVAAVFTGCAYIGCWFASVWTCHPPSTYFQFGKLYLESLELFPADRTFRRSMCQTHRQQRQSYLHFLLDRCGRLV